MSELPWNRFPSSEPHEPPPVVEEEPEPPQPEEPIISHPPAAPVPPSFEELPYEPPPSPALPPGFRTEIQEAVQESLSAVWPTLAEEAKDYALQSIQATVRGQEVDHRNPTITGSTAKGKELVIADAKSRSWRTLWQGLAVDVLFAVVAVLGTLTNFDPVEKTSWITLGALLIKSVLTAAVSFISRLKIAPTVKMPGQPALGFTGTPLPGVKPEKQKFFVLPDHLVPVPTES